MVTMKYDIYNEENNRQVYLQCFNGTERGVGYSDADVLSLLRYGLRDWPRPLVGGVLFSINVGSF